MKKEILTLRPHDYIVFNGGLKIENISEDLVMEVELPNRYTVTPLEVGCVSKDEKLSINTP